MFIYDTHTHTKEGSACAVSTAEEMARSYKKQGYDGICVTDHFFNGNSCIPRDLPWEERVELYCKGYEHSKKVGDEIGLKVFFGFEYNYLGTEFITFGVDKQWLKEHPEIMKMKLSDYIKLIDESGGMTVHVHPFREAGYIEMIRLIPELTECVEAYNTGNEGRDERFNTRAVKYARDYGKPCSAGSDSHDASCKFYAGIAVEKPIETIEQLMDILKNGKCKLYWHGEYLDQPREEK